MTKLELQRETIRTLIPPTIDDEQLENAVGGTDGDPDWPGREGEPDVPQG